MESLPILPHKMFADGRAYEEKGDLQLDSPLLAPNENLQMGKLPNFSKITGLIVS